MTKEDYMNLDEFYQLVKDNTAKETNRLNGNGIPLSHSKQKWLNHAYAMVRTLRDTYHHDPFVKDVATNILAELILVDGE